MDWNNVVADTNQILDTHYTQGREAIRFIVLHHNAGNLTVEDCYRVWQSREASAHYQVESSGRIGQLVWDSNTAWHAGNWWANQNSIGIEHADDNNNPWHISDACLENGAHLVAALCKYYNLGRPQWMVNVFPHAHFQPTACPASIASDQNEQYMRRAQYWYDVMSGVISEEPAERAVAVQLYEANNTDAQRFAIEWVDDTWFRLRNLACGLYLDVEWARTENGTPVQVYTPNSSKAQMWRAVEADTAEEYHPRFTAPIELIPAVDETKRLDVLGGLTDNGTKVQIYEKNNTLSQYFQLLDRGDGTLSIININSNKAIDVVGGGH